VLATSSIASTLLDRSRTLADAFDWVIIEEAAKAWPTEIMIPLVLAPRWTLIGDHHQLGPHRAHDLEAFLKSLSGYDDDLLKAVYAARQTHLKWLELFKSFFPTERTDVPATPLEPDVTAPLTGGSPIGQLNTLFRMHPKIAEPIRRVFYPARPVRLDENGFRISALEPDLEAVEGRLHGLIRPAELVGQPLVWVDTDSVKDLGGKNFRAVPYWYNEGEVEAVDDIVASMHPAATAVDADDRNSLAVLTPYHKQRHLLRERPRLKDSVFTVHSFQGREAQRVIVSLVRDQGADDNPARNVGLLAQDEVINVLLSRARSLLVLIGNFRHFQENAGPAWHWVTRIVEHYGRRVDASEVKDWTLE
jgi:superfamily I DNA and/or RNA helicase